MNIEEVLASHGIAGKKGLVERSGSVTLNAVSSTVTNPVTYNSGTEILFVFQNGTLIQRPAQYTVSGSTLTRVGGTWDKGTVIDFVVISGSAIPSGTFDASLMTDGTVTNAKLHSDVKVGSLATLTTTNKTSVVAAVNELKTDVGNRATLAQLAAADRVKLLGSSSFNSTTGQIISHSIGHTNYYVIITPTANPNGFLGEVWVEKASNSFKVLCSGSASVAFDYEVIV